MKRQVLLLFLMLISGISLSGTIKVSLPDIIKAQDTSSCTIATYTNDYFDDGHPTPATEAAEACRKGDIIYGLLDSVVGDMVTFRKITGITDSDIDGVYIRKKNNEFFCLIEKDGKIQATRYGLQNDNNPDNSQNMLKALTAMNKLKKPLYFKSGYYRINTWDNNISFSYINIVGDDRERTIITANHPFQTNLFNLSNEAVVDISEISIEGWNSVVYSDKTVRSICISRCKFSGQQTSVIYTEPATTSPGSSVLYFQFSNNVIEKTSGVRLLCNILKGAQVNNNIMTNLRRDLDTWQMPSSGWYAVVGLQIGPISDANRHITQDSTANIIIHGNIIDSLVNESLPGTSNLAYTNGIIVGGQSVTITNNIVKNLFSAKGEDVEAIYTKLKDGIIGYNLIFNGTMGNFNNTAAIAVKGGQAPGLAHESKNIKIVENFVFNTTDGYSGITIFSGGKDIEISGNTISGFLGNGLRVQGSQYPDSSGTIISSNPKNLFIHHNTFRENKGPASIYIVRNKIEADIIVENNYFKDNRGFSPSNVLREIWLLAASGTATSDSINNVLVRNNIFSYKHLSSEFMLRADLIAIECGGFIKNIEGCDNLYIVEGSDVSAINGFTVHRRTDGLIGRLFIDNNKFFTDTSNTSSIFENFKLNNSAMIRNNISHVASLFLGTNYKNGIEDIEQKKASGNSTNGYSMTSIDAYIELPAISSNQLFTLENPIKYPLRTVIIRNQNTDTSSLWSLSRAVKNPANNTDLTELTAPGVWTIQSDGTDWILISSQEAVPIPSILLPATNFTYSVSANGTTAISIPHSLGTAPSDYTVKPENQNAAGISWFELTSTAIILHYQTVPVGPLKYRVSLTK